MPDNEQSLYLTILIASILIGLIIVYFVIAVVRHHRREVYLFRQNLFAEINALDKERTRIAADLHDEFGPLISAVKLKLNSFELASSEDKIEVEKTNQQIDYLLKRTREISYNLLPNTLLRKGLVAAIKEFIHFIDKGSTVAIELKAPPQIELSEQKAIQVFRIVQEVIHNTIRHAEADQLIINIYEEKDTLVLKTIDNGNGFDHNTAFKNSEGLGLRNLLSRTEIMDGEMFVESFIGQGTVYTFEIRK